MPHKVWSPHRTLVKTIKVHSKVWWIAHRKEILEWMKDVDAEMSYRQQGEARPTIFLYHEWQMTYFALKWPQTRWSGNLYE